MKFQDDILFRYFTKNGGGGRCELRIGGIIQ